MEGRVRPARPEVGLTATAQPDHQPASHLALFGKSWALFYYSQLFALFPKQLLAVGVLASFFPEGVPTMGGHSLWNSALFLLFFFFFLFFLFFFFLFFFRAPQKMSPGGPWWALGEVRGRCAPQKMSPGWALVGPW